MDRPDHAPPSRHRVIGRLGAAVATALVMALSAPAHGAGGVADLVVKLQRGADFRVRVQAALELGKSKQSAAREPLEGSLDDDNAAVRAAAAAALKVLGDEKAVVALERHRKDPSPAVRSQIKSSLEALKAAAASQKTELLVQLGKIKNGGRVHSRSIDADVERTSREKIGQLPGVEVVEARAAKRRAKPKKGEPPLVMVTGLVRKLDHETRGESVVYSASVEFIVHQMPGQAIKGVVSGSARALGDASDAKDKRAMAELRRSAIEAAIESALKNAPEALRAASR